MLCLVEHKSFITSGPGWYNGGLSRSKVKLSKIFKGEFLIIF